MVKQCWSDWDKDNERNGLGKINFRNGADFWSRSYAVAIAYGVWMIAGLLALESSRSYRTATLLQGLPLPDWGPASADRAVLAVSLWIRTSLTRRRCRRIFFRPAMCPSTSCMMAPYMASAAHHHPERDESLCVHLLHLLVLLLGDAFAV